MKDLSTKSKNLMQHNLITNARYEMSALEMDVFFILLSKLKKDDAPKTLYRIYVKEVEEITGRTWNYQQFREATERFGSRVFEIDVSVDRFLQLWMLASVEYHFGEGYFELEISEKARPYLIELKENFTVYDLYSALSLTSKYAKRIYQLASQWKDIGRKTFLIEDIKEMLHLKDPKGKEPEQYKQIVELKKYVLEVAKEQINRSTDIELDYRLIKKGRSFKSIEFFIKVKKQKTKSAKNSLLKTESGVSSKKNEKIKPESSEQDVMIFISKNDKINTLMSLKKQHNESLQDLSEVELDELFLETLGNKYEQVSQDLLQKKQRTIQQLKDLGITRSDYINEIVNHRMHDFFKLYYDIQAGKYQSSNPSGYILMSLGLVKK
jgi:plasmid replication initiation protein